jgi:hypothetical protein
MNTLPAVYSFALKKVRLIFMDFLESSEAGCVRDIKKAVLYDGYIQMNNLERSIAAVAARGSNISV